MIEALQGRSIYQPAMNFITVIQYLATEFQARSIMDPANTNNTVSAELTSTEKHAIANAASSSLALPWPKVLW